MPQPSFITNVQEAEKSLQIAGHILYVTYPVVQDKRLFMKVITEAQKALAKLINAVLQYEYAYQRIHISKNPIENFETFKKKVARWYDLSQEEIASVVEIFEIVQQHNSSAMEFVKEDKIIILSETMSQKTINIEKVKQYLVTIQKILFKVKTKWNMRI